MLSPVRWSFGSRPIVAIRRLSSTVMPRRCSVWRTASSIWQEKQCLSVWFIFEDQTAVPSGVAVYLHILMSKNWHPP